MLLQDNVQYRRAIEALRSGVPNQDAVRALGGGQPDIEDKFRQQLEAAREGVASNTQTTGLLVAGDFGSGKSHLLEYLQHLALEANFVCSKVVISKETPLHDPAKLYRAAIQAAVVPGKKGSALTEVATSLNFDSSRYTDLFRWVDQSGLGLNSRFPATLFLYERVKDPEVLNRIISFWSGDPLNVGELQKWLRAYGEAASYKLEKISARELPFHRFKFTPRLMVAAGYSGWVLLVDEVELIGRYSFKQRARSYAELARWAGTLEGESFPGLTTVFAITSDFEKAVLDERDDEEKIPARLRASGQELDSLLASQAERGMRLIRRDSERLGGPTPQLIDQSNEKLRDIYAKAYQWEPPDHEISMREQSTVMRQYVRRWINEWDLARLYPDYKPQTIVEELKMDYSEDPDLEGPSEGDSDADP